MQMMSGVLCFWRSACDYSLSQLWRLTYQIGTWVVLEHSAGFPNMSGGVFALFGLAAKFYLYDVRFPLRFGEAS